MARVTFKGLDEYERKLEKLGMTSGQDAGKAIYTGAGIVADAIRRSIDSIPTTKVIYTKSGAIDGLTSEQKNGLKEGLGISRASSEGEYRNVKIGFAGYNKVRTKHYPNGQPNVLIARAVTSGTSFRRKHPFVAPAVQSAKPKAEAEMIRIIDEGIKKAMEG